MGLTLVYLHLQPARAHPPRRRGRPRAGCCLGRGIRGISHLRRHPGEILSCCRSGAARHLRGPADQDLRLRHDEQAGLADPHADQTGGDGQDARPSTPRSWTQSGPGRKAIRRGADGMSSRRPCGYSLAVVVGALAAGLIYAGSGRSMSAADAKGRNEIAGNGNVQGGLYPGDPATEARLVEQEDERLVYVRTIASAARWRVEGLEGPYRIRTGSAYTLVLPARPRGLQRPRTSLALAPQAFPFTAWRGGILLSESVAVLAGATLALKAPGPARPGPPALKAERRGSPRGGPGRVPRNLGGAEDLPFRSQAGTATQGRAGRPSRQMGGPMSASLGAMPRFGPCPASPTWGFGAATPGGFR